MFDKLIHKAYAQADVMLGTSISATLTSMPFWVDAISDGLQIVTLVVGIAVGVSAYRLNVERTAACRANSRIKEKHNE